MVGMADGSARSSCVYGRKPGNLVVYHDAAGRRSPRVRLVMSYGGERGALAPVPFGRSCCPVRGLPTGGDAPVRQVHLSCGTPERNPS